MLNMTLLPDWRDVLKKAWSIKFMALAGLVAGCETLLQLGGREFLPPWVVPSVTSFLASLGVLARLLAQHESAALGTDIGGQMEASEHE